MRKAIQIAAASVWTWASEVVVGLGVRWGELRAHTDRGGGRESLMEVVLAVAGMAVAGVVVAAIAALVHSKTGQLR